MSERKSVHRRRQLPEHLYEVTLLTLSQAEVVAGVSRTILKAWFEADGNVHYVPVGTKEQRIPYGDLKRVIESRMPKTATDRAKEILGRRRCA